MARKSRVHRPETEPGKHKTWYVGIYLRLSREDPRARRHIRDYDVSESVATQLDMVTHHLDHMDDGDEYTVAEIFVDDGISGTTDEGREDFQRMLRWIEDGRINCIIVKDLSRSFRNYADQGYYLDDWFPRRGIRFISLSQQPLDSYRNPEGMRNIGVPFQGILNEQHCADTSIKVRDAFDIKRREGQFIGAFAPYGYKKNPENKNQLLIDEPAAAVVREIFGLFLGGMSKIAIARELNSRGVPCPSAYKREVQKLNYRMPQLDPDNLPLWSARVIAYILANPMYCGDMVQGRHRVKSYKVHELEAVPPEQWYIKPDTHEPIIDRKIFEQVRQLGMRDTRTGPSQKAVYLFGGFLRCADCGKAMARHKGGDGVTVYYYCRTYKEKSKAACTKHTIRQDRLEAAVLRAVQQQIYLAVRYAGATEAIDKAPRAPRQSAMLTHTLNQKRQELAKTQRYKQAAWQDWKDGELAQADYRRMRAEYAQRASELERHIKRLEREADETKCGAEALNPLLTAYRQHQNITQLTREVIVELIDRIQVHEGGNITVRFRFADELGRTRDFL